MSRILYLAAFVYVVAIASVTRIEAQFDTANRQFHNQTSFPLDGRHRDVPCESCHRQSVYKGTPARCFDCHWERRQDDRYRLALGAQCEQCHRTPSWSAVRWDHGAMTGMPLAGAHAGLSCQSCHGSNGFRTVQTGCFSCHQQEYQATRSPNHAAAGFPTTCENCHRPTATQWQGSAVDHSIFPLVGRHASATCATCHINNLFRGTSRDCVGCHRTQYDRTASPNHAAAGFPTACESCHRATDASWQQGRFAHRFPIASGPHRQTCATCHQASSSFATFTCLTCHEHSRERMDDKHRERGGYRYDSLACYSCHPTGRGN